MRPKLSVLIGFLALFAALPSAWAVNKCLVDGKTVYQDAPCSAGAGTKLELPSSPGTTPGTAPSQLPARPQSSAGRIPVDNTAVLNGMATGKPVVGMTENQLNIAMGRPNRTNAGNYEGQQRDQLIYDRGDVTYYVYVREGVVSSVQASSGYRPRPVRRGRCLTALEVRNLQTSANSVTISERERLELYRQIREGKEACE